MGEPELLTLSDVPPAKWQATLNLDLVKERNKPTEAPKPLPNAPFFLPTAHEGVTPRFASFEAAEDAERQPLDATPAGGGGRSRVLQRGDGSLEAAMPMQTMLRRGDYEDALKFLKVQTPSGVHLALEELGPLAGGDVS